MAKRATPKQGRVLKRTQGSPKNPAQPPAGEQTNKPAADLEAFHYHKGCIERAQASVAAVRKMLKTERRRASDAGINLADLDLVMKMAEQEPETVQATVNRIATYASWMGLAPGVQGNLFEAADDKADVLKVAEHEGYVEGLEGKTAEGDRYDPASEAGQARLTGWNRGQDVYRNRFQPLEQPTHPAPDATQ